MPGPRLTSARRCHPLVVHHLTSSAEREKEEDDCIACQGMFGLIGSTIHIGKAWIGGA